jgi:hypothetical protein
MGTVSMPKSSSGAAGLRPSFCDDRIENGGRVRSADGLPRQSVAVPVESRTGCSRRNFCPSAACFSDRSAGTRRCSKAHRCRSWWIPTGARYPLKRGENIVGREGADVLLPDRSVSRRHAQFQVAESGAVTVSELGSTNGSRHGR